MTTVLAFQATENVTVGTKKVLGTVDVSPYAQIRVVAYENAGGQTNVEILLEFTDAPSGGTALGPLDTLTLSPNSNQTKVYQVPGTYLAITANALPGPTGFDGVGLFIYGN
jgi:hypothetical protein